MISSRFPGSLGGGRYVLLVTIHPAAFTVQDAMSYFTPKEPRGAGMDLFDILLRACPGAPPQRMSLGDGGRVCTQSDTVRLRVEPSRSANFERQLAPGSQFTVVDGPACADNWSWWFVTVEDGEWGWVAQGGDEAEPYFICPLP